MWVRMWEQWGCSHTAGGIITWENPLENCLARIYLSYVCLLCDPASPLQKQSQKYVHENWQPNTGNNPNGFFLYVTTKHSNIQKKVLKKQNKIQKKYLKRTRPHKKPRLYTPISNKLWHQHQDFCSSCQWGNINMTFHISSYHPQSCFCN